MNSLIFNFDIILRIYIYVHQLLRINICQPSIQSLIFFRRLQLTPSKNRSLPVYSSKSFPEVPVTSWRERGYRFRSWAFHVVVAEWTPSFKTWMWIWCEYDVNMMWIWCEYDIIYDTWIIMDSKKKYHFGIWYGIVDITWYYMIWSYLSPIFLTAGCSSFTLDYMMLEPAKRGLSHDAWTCAGSGDVFFTV